MLTLENMEVRYEAALAVQGVSLTLSAGSITALIGSNGAGKSSLLKAAAGLVDSHQGRITLGAQDLSHRSASDRAKAGLVLVPEGREVFPFLSVRENLEVIGDGPITPLLDMFPDLVDRLSVPAGQLSGGEQQMLAIARALRLKPKVLLLDEPSLGLSPQLAKRTFDLLPILRDQWKLTLLLVDQNAKLALGIADQAAVMETGRIALSGSAATVAEHPEIATYYLRHSPRAITLTPSKRRRRWS